MSEKADRPKWLYSGAHVRTDSYTGHFQDAYFFWPEEILKVCDLTRYSHYRWGIVILNGPEFTRILRELQQVTFRTSEYGSIVFDNPGHVTEIMDEWVHPFEPLKPKHRRGRKHKMRSKL